MSKNSSSMVSVFDKNQARIVSPKVMVSCLFRKLNQNKRWLKDIIEEYTEYKLEQKMRKESLTDLDNDLLDAKDKMALLQHKSYRTDAEIKTIAEKIQFTLPFVRYPGPITEDLVRHAHLQGYEAGRTLFLSKQSPLSAYFILNGVIEVVPEETKNPIIEFLKLKREGELGKLKNANIYTRGDMVGRKELLFDEPRKRTVRVKQDVLCIKFEKKFMLQALEPILALWLEVFSQLQIFHFFGELGKDVMRDLCKFGRIVNYGVNKLVNAPDTSYFLIEGEAYVIQRLLVQKFFDKGTWSLKLYEQQDAMEYADDVDPVYMQVMVLNRGAYFGLGERMSKHVIWTKTHTKFVQFYRTELFKYGSYSLWERQTNFLDRVYPSTEQLFEHLMYGRQWSKYKNEINNKITSNREHSKIHDVPMPLRRDYIKLSKRNLKKHGITSMDDYLKGGLDPAEDELRSEYILDRNGDLREKLFGRYKTKPNFKGEEHECH